MEGSGGSGLSLRSNDLDTVGELYTEDDFLQLVVTVEATPGFLGDLDELEDHGERRSYSRDIPLSAPCGGGLLRTSFR